MGLWKELSGTWNESAGVLRGLWLSTLAVVVALAFNNFFDSLLQIIVPFQEKTLQTVGQVTMYRLLVTIFLLMILFASSIILSMAEKKVNKSATSSATTMTPAKIVTK